MGTYLLGGLHFLMQFILMKFICRIALTQNLVTQIWNQNFYHRLDRFIPTLNN